MTLDKDDLDEVEEFLNDIGKESISERVGEQIEDETERLSQLVELKSLVKNAEEAGLGDDPAVAALRDRVATLSNMADVVETPVSEQLTTDHDIPEFAVDRLSEDEADELLRHLENAEQLSEARGGRAGGRIVEQSAEHHRAEAQRILKESSSRMSDSRAAALAGGSTDDRLAGDTDDADDGVRSATERLAADHDLNRTAVAQLSAGQSEQLLEHMEALEPFDGVDDPGRLQENVIQKHVDGIREVLDGTGMTPGDLESGGHFPGGGRQ
jgi:hypothetical protein